jgi:hypothetical protein
MDTSSYHPIQRWARTGLPPRYGPSVCIIDTENPQLLIASINVEFYEKEKELLLS